MYHSHSCISGKFGHSSPVSYQSMPTLPMPLACRIHQMTSSYKSCLSLCVLHKTFFKYPISLNISTNTCSSQTNTHSQVPFNCAKSSSNHLLLDHAKTVLVLLPLLCLPSSPRTQSVPCPASSPLESQLVLTPSSAQILSVQTKYKK